VTGFGWITPLGDDIETVWQRLLKGDSGIAPTTIFDATTFPSTFSAEVKEFDLAKYLKPADVERHREGSRNTAFALSAARIAWDHAGLQECNGLDKTRVGIYLGGGEGPIDFHGLTAAALAGWDREAGGGRGDLDATQWVEMAAQVHEATCELEQEQGMAAGHLACLFNAQGPVFNTLTACAASTQAIGEAMNFIRRGDAEVVISGGTHSMIHPMGVTGFNRLTALSTRNDSCMTASRPFDRTRDGFVLGEGAGMLILEELEHAKERGATILAEVVGYGSTADAFRITDIHEEGRGGIAAMRQALADARMQTTDIDYISAHGTGTEENDKIETLAIQGVFNDHARNVPISSIKSMMGHLIAAAGAVELITCILAIRDNIIPPTMNYGEPDPNCPLDYVPNEARKSQVDVCLSNSFGFGGQNDTLIVKRFEM
jgi:3-oxoacyl-[acyl-carrier-protein] synthase II